MSELQHKHGHYVGWEPSIHDLRRLGWKVRVLHGTVNEEQPDKITQLSDKFTRIELRTPDGKEFVGVSYCSKKDNFNRKLGNRIALGRALKAALSEMNPG